MNDTPRTDEWLEEEKRNPRLSGLGNWLDYCKQLERELTAVTEQRDEAREVSQASYSDSSSFEYERAILDQFHRACDRNEKFRDKFRDSKRHMNPKELDEWQDNIIEFGRLIREVLELPIQYDENPTPEIRV